MSLRYLLDTNTVSLALRGKAPTVVERLRETQREIVGISVITAMELQFGLAKTPSLKLRPTVERFLEVMEVVPLDRRVERPYAELRALLEKRGRPIGALDTMLAAHALALEATFVTNNTKEFRRVPNLRCEDWCR